jgi:hypothetical protein
LKMMTSSVGKFSACTTICRFKHANKDRRVSLGRPECWKRKLHEGQRPPAPVGHLSLVSFCLLSFLPSVRSFLFRWLVHSFLPFLSCSCTRAFWPTYVYKHSEAPAPGNIRVNNQSFLSTPSTASPIRAIFVPARSIGSVRPFGLRPTSSCPTLCRAAVP